MTCPRCYAEFEKPARSCPECGAHLMRAVSGVMKTSAVMIAAGDEPAFYRSVQEVPEPLRTQLIESTHSTNSGTIVIADKAGKDQITQVIARRENAKLGRPSPEPVAEPDPKPEPRWPETMLRFKLLGYSWVVWVGILLFLAAAALISAVFTMHR